MSGIGRILPCRHGGGNVGFWPFCGRSRSRLSIHLFSHTAWNRRAGLERAGRSTYAACVAAREQGGATAAILTGKDVSTYGDCQ